MLILTLEMLLEVV